MNLRKAFLSIALAFTLLFGASPAFAANLAFNSVSSYTDTVGSASAASPAKASGTASGQLLVMHVEIVVGSGSRTIDLPTGGSTWIAAGAQQTVSIFGGGAIAYHRTYYKIAGGSEPSTYGVTWDGAASCLIKVVAYDNPDTTTPYQASSQVFTNNASGTSITLPSITTTAANQLLVGFVYSDGGGSGTTFTSAALTERSDSGSAAYDTLQVSAGASGTKLVTAAATGGNYGTMLSFNSATGSSPATLSSATPSGTLGTSTTATVGATTDQTSGTLYAVVDTAGNLSGVTDAQIKAGQKASGASALAACTATVSTTTPSCGITGLAASTGYTVREIHNNANGDSNQVTNTFTTAASSPTLGGKFFLLQ